MRCRDLIILVVVVIPLVACRPKITSMPVNSPQKSSLGDGERTIATRVRFIDRAREAGVEFTPTNGEEAGKKSILETLGVGAAIWDYDLDGHLDLLFPGGGLIGDQVLYGRPLSLWRNLTAWSFENVATSALLDDALLYSHGVATGDYDSDGFVDVLITGYQGVRLYRNLGDGSFEHVTSPVMLQHKAWSTSAAWGDLNGDSVLDCYVVNYVDWSWDNNPRCVSRWGMNDEEVDDNCPPERFSGQPDWLFVGDGEGGFREVASKSGIVTSGKGLAVLLGDVDLDGDLDIYVANDATPNSLYRNSGAGQFVDCGVTSGTALSEAGLPDGSMGIDMADCDLDGLPDLWVSNYQDQDFALYRNLGECLFQHAGRQLRITAVGTNYVAFGTVFLDFENDGDEDMFVANGHVMHTVRKGPFRQLPLLFENLGGTRFVNVASQAGTYSNTPHMGRGVAAGDLDNDGDLDLAIAHTNEPVAVLANESTHRGNWLALRLIGVSGNRDAVGARIKVQTGDRAMTRQVKGGSSYLSASDRRVFLGLGEHETADLIEIQWPNGTIQQLDQIEINRLTIVYEPDSME